MKFNGNYRTDFYHWRWLLFFTNKLLLSIFKVFVQYSAMSLDPDHEGEFSRTAQQTLTGPVVVTRNPCLHPGDVRLLTAVYAPQLAHLEDCVVFPNHGPRPHPSEMAGITYTHSDGDNFWNNFSVYLFIYVLVSSALSLTYLKKKRQRQQKK